SFWDIRDLHSFPTRRSSDLWYSRFVYPFAEIDTDAFWKSAYTFLRHACIDSIQPREKTSSAVVTVTSGERAYIRSDGAHCITPRSEEHTSELQSRENLVCRL